MTDCEMRAARFSSNFSIRSRFFETKLSTFAAASAIWRAIAHCSHKGGSGTRRDLISSTARPWLGGGNGVLVQIHRPQQLSKPIYVGVMVSRDHDGML